MTALPTPQQPMTDHDRRVIAANRAMAEAGIVRIDYRSNPAEPREPQGLERFRRALEQREWMI